MIRALFRRPIIQKGFLVLAAALMAAIIYLSLRASSGLPPVTNADKVSHFIAYFALATCLGLGLPRLPLILLVVFAFLFGVGIEVAQGAMGAGRTFSYLDMFANLAGAIAAAVLVWILLPRPQPVDSRTKR